MKKIWLPLFLVLALAFTTASSALAAKTWVLNIHNNTEDTVKITLTGPENYSFDVAPGKYYKEVEEGDYTYKYGACNQKVEEDITVEDSLQWIIIDPCTAALEYAKFAVDSRIPSPITLKMDGPQSLELQIDPLERNRFISLPVGFYAYSYDACGGTYGGEVRLTKNGKSSLVIYPCEVVDYRLGTEENATVDNANLRIGSHYSFPIRLTVFGPSSYSLVVNLGLNRFHVFPGTYTYSYTAYGQTKSGSFVVDESGAWFTISPLK